MYYSISLAGLEPSCSQPSQTFDLQPQIDKHACAAQSLFRPLFGPLSAVSVVHIIANNTKIVLNESYFEQSQCTC